MPNQQHPAVPLARVHELVDSTLFTTDWMTVDRGRSEMFDLSIGATPEETDLSISEANPLGADLINGCWLLGWLVTVHFNHSPIREPGLWGLQYGFDKVRFLAPVRIGTRIRWTSVLEEVREHPAGRVLVTRNTVELEGNDKPAAVINHLALYSTQAVPA
jgi:acyl dehydratase